MELTGRTALVTGAARGIGRAIAERLACAGANVALADLSTDSLARTVELVEAHGAQTLAMAVDVTSKPKVDAMAARTLAHFGRLDALFNNAGIIEVEPFLAVSESSWDRIMEVNAKGVFLCGQAAARAMIEAGKGGCIINTASVASRIGIPDMAAYAASKAAVMSLTRSMAIALASHSIRVNAVAPGIVDTDMWDQIDAQRSAISGQPRGEPVRRRVAEIPLQRPATPADVASLAVFLVTDEAAYITGQTYNVDGGSRPS